MYGVVAGQRSEGSSRKRNRQEQCCSDEKPPAAKGPTGIKQRIVAYLKKQLNPPPDEEYAERIMPRAATRLELTTLERDTKFTRNEIKLMYRGFKQECPTGEVDEDTFKNIFSQFFPLGDATQYATLVFNTIKDKDNDKLTFEQFLAALSVWGRGSRGEKLSCVFALYDCDGDGRVSRGEMRQVAGAVHALIGNGHDAGTLNAHVDNIFTLMDADRDGVVTRDELVQWLTQQPALLTSLDHTDTVL